MRRNQSLLKLKAIIAAQEDPYLEAERECQAVGLTVEQAIKILRKVEAEIDREQKLCGPLLREPLVHQQFNPQFALLATRKPKSATISFNRSFVQKLPRQPSDNQEFTNLGRLRSYIRSEALSNGYLASLRPDGRFGRKKDRDSGYEYYFITVTRVDKPFLQLSTKVRNYLQQLS
jgi:hypothetical protein